MGERRRGGERFGRFEGVRVVLNGDTSKAYSKALEILALLQPERESERIPQSPVFEGGGRKPACTNRDYPRNGRNRNLDTRHAPSQG